MEEIAWTQRKETETIIVIMPAIDLDPKDKAKSLRWKG